MIEIEVNFEVWTRGTPPKPPKVRVSLLDSGGDRPEEKEAYRLEWMYRERRSNFLAGGTEFRSAKLFLSTLAPLTPQNAKSKKFGRWQSPSPYLGREHSGRYYVVDIAPSMEEALVLGEYEPELNPVAFFLDSEKDPFLVLRRFRPAGRYLAGRDPDKERYVEGIDSGRLMRTSMTDLASRKIRWTVTSISGRP